VSGAAGAWRVWLSEKAQATINEAAAAAHPCETGGILVGVIGHAGGGSGRPWVTHAVEVRSRESGPTRYALPGGAREPIVRELRKTDLRLGYLGDWHSHPVNVDPSGTDVAAIASIAITGDCPRPVLFVVRRMNGCYEIDARQWTGASLRRLQVRDAGPLEAALPTDRRAATPKLGRPRGRRS
jgi:proteasome lid subunit RPN8/RPN11